MRASPRLNQADFATGKKMLSVSSDSRREACVHPRGNPADLSRVADGLGIWLEVLCPLGVGILFEPGSCSPSATSSCGPTAFDATAGRSCDAGGKEGRRHRSLVRSRAEPQRSTRGLTTKHRAANLPTRCCVERCRVARCTADSKTLRCCAQQKYQQRGGWRSICRESPEKSCAV